MMPWTLGTTLLPHLGADERGVRECPVCPSWTVACFHAVDPDGGEAATVRIAYTTEADTCWGTWLFPGVYLVSGPAKTCPCDCDPTHRVFWAAEARPSRHDTEAEARAEFERRVSLMLGREVE